MKKLVKFTMTLALSSLIGGTASAAISSIDHVGSMSTNAPGMCSTNGMGHMDTNAPPVRNTNAAVELAAHAAVFYAAVAPFDTSGAGVLNAAEEAELAMALTNGTVHIFGTNTLELRPHEVTNAVVWIAALYAELAKFDVNHNGMLDATEQAALVAALEKGTVTLPLFAPLLFGHEEEQNHHASLSQPSSVWPTVHCGQVSELMLPGFSLHSLGA